VHELESLEAAIRRTTGLVDPDTVAGTARVVELGDDDETEVRIRYVLGPASASEAADRLVAQVAARLDGLQEVPSEDESAREQAMEALLRPFDSLGYLAQLAPRDIREATRRLPLVGLTGYAERVMTLRRDIDALDLALPAPFLRFVSTSSRRGAALAREHGLRRSSLRRAALRAILTGIARFPPRRDELPEVKQLIHRRATVESEIGQLAYIGRRGRPSLADQLFDGDVPDAIFDAAEMQIHRSPRATKELLTGVILWREVSASRRKQLADRFAKLLRLIRTHQELEVVLGSLVVFCDEPYRVEHVRRLRAALIEVMNRTGPASLPSLQPLIEQAALHLGLEGQTKFSKLADAFLKDLA
jgi:hypothetical protein